MELDDLLGAEGPLRETIPGYRLRPQQRELAQAVAAAIAEGAALIAEAGTGTGKTLAYLLPALLSGGKVILSTGTKTLQDQLFERDIPSVKAAVARPVTVALLKGRANYVCPFHLKRHLADGRFARREDFAHLRAIEAYAARGGNGDRAGLAEVPEAAPAWALATSTRENCLGGDCPELRGCFLMEARRQALAADLVVVNHHLFFADLWLRDEGVAELLPNCNTVIFDEAHQLPATARLFFGETVSTGQLVELSRDVRIEAQAAADFRPLPLAAQALEAAARALRDGDREPRSAQRGVEFAARATALLDTLQRELDALEGLLKSQSERSDGLENCRARAQALAERLKRWRTTDEEGAARWVEFQAGGLSLHRTPLSVAELFRRQLGAGAKSWIFTSATLAVRGDFSHYQREMGLEEARTASWPSPFEYEKQALLYVPEQMPEPNTEGFGAAVVEAVMPVLTASQGRAFLLFTSLRAMRDAHERVGRELVARGLDFPLLFQEEAPRRELLIRFRALGNAVLVASQSFFEGVDVRGEALSLVVIDRLPFASPDDPVLAARLERHAEQGGKPFMDIQVPEAAILLKQGAGRLIRDERDRGVLMICDPRLVTRPYGRRIWQSLPPMRRTRSLEEVQAFFLALRAAPA